MAEPKPKKSLWQTVFGQSGPIVPQGAGSVNKNENRTGDKAKELDKPKKKKKN